LTPTRQHDIRGTPTRTALRELADRQQADAAHEHDEATADEATARDGGRPPLPTA
jgi:hypothetical protein